MRKIAKHLQLATLAELFTEPLAAGITPSSVLTMQRRHIGTSQRPTTLKGTLFKATPHCGVGWRVAMVSSWCPSGCASGWAKRCRGRWLSTRSCVRVVMRCPPCRWPSSIKSFSWLRVYMWYIVDGARPDQRAFSEIVIAAGSIMSMARSLSTLYKRKIVAVLEVSRTCERIYSIKKQKPTYTSIYLAELISKM